MRPPHQELEFQLARWLQCEPEQVVACSSGTAALHLALESLGLNGRSEVIVPDFTMIAVPRAVTLSNLVTVAVDCDHTFNMDQYLLQMALQRPSVEGMVAVHTYGRRFDLDAFHLLNPDSKIKIVEDMAELHGVRPHRLSDAACWSFYKNKVIHGEEGGAVYFKDRSHADLARSLRCLGFTQSHDYTHIPRGHNYRLADSLAAQILRSLSTLEHSLSFRRRLEALYDRYCPTEWSLPRRDSVWVYDLQVPGMTRDTQDRVVQSLRNCMVHVRHGFKPVHTQPEYKGGLSVLQGHSEIVSREVLYFEVDPDRTTEDTVRASMELLDRFLHDA